MTLEISSFCMAWRPFAGIEQVSSKQSAMPKPEIMMVASLFIYVFFWSLQVAWSVSHLKECGHRNVVTGQKFQTTQEELLEYPWNVAIYKQDNYSKIYNYICSGSIVSENAIVTAAHCIYNEAESAIDKANFIVAAGKYNNSWDYRSSIEQRFEVKDIKLPETYKGMENKFANDIAVLALNESINFNGMIMPICLDWRSDDPMPTVGTVVGWGFLDEDVIGSRVGAVEIKYYNTSTCRIKTEPPFTPYIVDDKFCGYHSSITTGNAGSGFAVSRKINNTEQYYLYGISELKEKGSNMIVFTDVMKHQTWLKLILSSFSG